MPQDKASATPNAGADQILNNLTVLTLPWLCLQRDLIAIGKQGLQDYSHVRPMQNFALRELQALMMVLDPSRTVRSSYDGMEARLEDAYAKSISHLVSGMSDMLAAQETVVNCAIETLSTKRKGKKGETPSAD